MSTVSLSVIVPFYNSGKYISSCLDSLLGSEGIDSTEIILVDDGSSDESVSIADTYAEKYTNIIVIHKKNEGPSAARNTGLLKARGEYVFFCDSDDYVVSKLFGKIIALSKESSCDMLLWDAELLYETVNLLMPKNRNFFSHSGLPKIEKTYSGKELLETSLRNSGDFVATVWLGAYRKAFLTDNGLFFKEGLIHEDEFWVPQVFIKASSVHYIPEKIYVYRIHEGSIMNPGTMDREESSRALMYVYPALYEYYDSALEGEPLRKLIEGNLTKRYLHMIYKYRIWRYGYGKKIDKKLLWRTSVRLRDKVLVLPLYLIAR